MSSQHHFVSTPPAPAPSAPDARAGGTSLRTFGIIIAVLFGLWATLAQVLIIIGLAWVIPAFAMAGRTGRPWYNVMNWLWALGPFALLILGRPRQPYATFGEMVGDNPVAAGVIALVGVVFGFGFLSAIAQLV